MNYLQRICRFKLLESPKIAEETETITIALISDVHLGLIVRGKRLRSILREIEKVNPEILISAGDLVDGQMNTLEGLAEEIKSVDVKYGKFAITGNHEFYAELDQALNFTRRAGFKILKGEAITVEDVIAVAGIDDRTGKRYGLHKVVRERKLLSKLPREKFTLLIKHMPLVEKDAIGFFDLQLSGHTHGGQIFPFSLITRLFFPETSGLVRLPKNSHLYVSRGSGTWGPPIRFLAPPEVTIIRLSHGEFYSCKILN